MNLHKYLFPINAFMIIFRLVKTRGTSTLQSKLGQRELYTYQRYAIIFINGSNFRKEKHAMGWRTVSRPNHFQRRLSIYPSQSQIRSTTISPQCLSIRNSLPVLIGRRKGLEASHYNQTNPFRYEVQLIIIEGVFDWQINCFCKCVLPFLFHQGLVQLWIVINKKYR